MDYRGAEIKRILPRINEEINEEWLSDKGRHAHDGAKKQRLSVPLIRNEHGEYTELKWEEAIKIAADKFKNTNRKEIAGILGDMNDVETIVALKDLFARIDSENLFLNSVFMLKRKVLTLTLHLDKITFSIRLYKG